MKQTNLNEIQPNSSAELITKIGKDRIKRLAKPDTSKMYSVSGPLRSVFYCKTLERAKKRVKILTSENLGMVVTITAPNK